jgi:glycerophosphoryl diester phosphodiesterase
MRRFSPQMRALDWLIARPIAHRGLHDATRNIIENTSSAFAAAMQHGYAIESDLQIAADGEAMVFHDEALKRLCGIPGDVKQHSSAALKKMELIKTADRMQTLGELLDQVDGKVPLVIELKSHWNDDARLVQRALKVLEPYHGPYALMSFDPDSVEHIAHLSPGTVRGITADRGVDDYYKMLPVARRLELQGLTHLPRTQPHFASFHFRDLPFAPIQNLRNAGLPIITWTIRTPEQAKQALRFSDQITFERYLAP